MVAVLSSAIRKTDYQMNFIYRSYAPSCKLAFNYDEYLQLILCRTTSHARTHTFYIKLPVNLTHEILTDTIQFPWTSFLNFHVNLACIALHYVRFGGFMLYTPLFKMLTKFKRYIGTRSTKTLNLKYVFFLPVIMIQPRRLSSVNSIA